MKIPVTKLSSVPLSMSLDYFCCEIFSFPILREERKKNLSVELCELSECLAALASSLDFLTVFLSLYAAQGAEVPLENPTMGLQPARICKSRTSHPSPCRRMA